MTREEIQAEVWSDGTVVEFEQGLNYCIRQIRLTLGDDAKAPRYIETIPKRGYRFMHAAEPLVDATPKAPTTSRRGNRAWPWMPASAVGIFPVLALIFWPAAGPALPDNPDAARLYIEAKKIEDDHGDLADAVQLYTRVTELAPDFATGWAALANLEVRMVNGSPRTAAKARADSEHHALKALEIDGSLAFAHAVLAHCYWHQWRWNEAESEFKQALARDNKVPEAHQLYGLYLASRGRKEQAVEHGKRAVELAPGSGNINFSYAMVLYQTGNFPAAIAQALRTQDFSRQFPLAYNVLVPAYALAGDLTTAWSTMEEYERFDGRGDGKNRKALQRAQLLARMNKPTEARAEMEEYLKSRKPNSPIPTGIAAAWSALGDYDAAFASLGSAVDGHVGDVIFLKSVPILEPLRSDPRFQDLLARIGNP